MMVLETKLTISINGFSSGVSCTFKIKSATGEPLFGEPTAVSDATLDGVNGNLKLTPFTLKQQSKIDPFDDLLRLNLWLNSYSLFIF